jgi:ornithine carbamoyltransferase
MSSKATIERPDTAVPVQKDTDILAAAARLAGEDMCSIADLSSAEVRAILKLGHDVKRNPREYRHALDAKQMVLMFEKVSLRTRLAFETGINTMGGNAIFVDQTNSPLGERESIADVARNVERWVDVIVLRTYAHDTITEMAANSRVPVINALSDDGHPIQVLCDVLTVEEALHGPIAGTRVAFVGDCASNMARSWLEAATLFGFHLVLAGPRGHMPPPDEVARAGTNVTLVHDPEHAVDGCDVVNTDVWTSMGQEAEGDERTESFAGWMVNAAMMANAPAAVVLHCLPAHRGEEIDDATLEGPQSRVWDQAENRLHVQKALLVWLLGAAERLDAKAG